MEKVIIAMSQKEYKKFLAFKEADKIVRSIKKGLKEVEEAKKGKRILQSHYKQAKYNSSILKQFYK